MLQEGTYKDNQSNKKYVKDIMNICRHAHDIIS